MEEKAAQSSQGPPAQAGGNGVRDLRCQDFARPEHQESSAGSRLDKRTNEAQRAPTRHPSNPRSLSGVGSSAEVGPDLTLFTKINSKYLKTDVKAVSINPSSKSYKSARQPRRASE